LKKAGLKRINISLDTVDADRYREITRGGDINRVMEGISAAKRVGFNPIKLNCVVDTDSNEENARGVTEYALRENLLVRYIPLMNLRSGVFGRVEGGDGGNCAECSRLRLTATGMLKPCLFNDIEFNIRELGASKAIELALKHKPHKGGNNNTGCFYNIGG